MQQKYGRVRPGLNYLQMDALQTDFSAGSFSTIFDKGTLDALFPDDSEESKSRITRLLNVSFVHIVKREVKYGVNSEEGENTQCQFIQLTNVCVR